MENSGLGVESCNYTVYIRRRWPHHREVGGRPDTLAIVRFGGGRTCERGLALTCEDSGA